VARAATASIPIARAVSSVVNATTEMTNVDVAERAGHGHLPDLSQDINRLLAYDPPKHALDPLLDANFKALDVDFHPDEAARGSARARCSPVGEIAVDL
jgi:hypothetical protein